MLQPARGTWLPLRQQMYLARVALPLEEQMHAVRVALHVEEEMQVARVALPGLWSFVSADRSIQLPWLALRESDSGMSLTFSSGLPPTIGECFLHTFLCVGQCSR